MNDLTFQLVSALRGLSPSSRRWRRFLRGLPIDPDRLPNPLEEPHEDSFIICGAPRTGTTLLSAMLVQPPEVFTVMEPWDGLRVPPAELFRQLRRSAEETGAAPAGKLDLEALRRSGEVSWARDGAQSNPVADATRLTLGVKWPIFWRYLPHLSSTRFLVCLRHPEEVIASFRKQGGRLRQGLDYDTPFNREMNRTLTAATRDIAARRVLLFDYIHERIIPYLERPNVLAVRYERWFTEPDRQLREISEFLGLELSAAPAKIRRGSKPDLSPRERSLIRSLCRTAAPLGYELQR